MKVLKSIIILTLTILSCQSQEKNLEDKLIGQWVIEEFQNKNKDLKYEYYVNVLSFKENFLTLPESRDSLINTENSTWELMQMDSENVILKVSSSDSSFAGLYEIDFFKNYDKKLLGLKLESDNSTLILYKVRQNFDLDGGDWERE